MKNRKFEHSPLEGLRHSMALAEHVDAIVAQAEPKATEQNRDEIEGLIQQAADCNPHFGKPIEITGHVVPHTINEDMALGLGEPPAPGSDAKKTTVSGMSHGLVMWNFTGRRGAQKHDYHRLTYAVQTGNEHSKDAVGNNVHKEIMEYVCASGAEVGYYSYLDAHSMLELQPLKHLVAKITAIHTAPRLAPFHRIKAIGGIANKYFASGLQPELRGQVVSYINSLKPLEGICLLASDYLIQPPESKCGQAPLVQLSKRNVTEELEPLHFMVGAEYTRDTSATERLGPQQVLYAKALTSSGDNVMVTTGNVLDAA